MLNKLNRFIFLITHTGSEYESLRASFNENQQIDILDSDTNYSNPMVLEPIFNNRHKLDNLSSYYGDTMTHNHKFSCSLFYQHCKFIYYIREPRGSLLDCSADYYVLRLRRIYEMIKNTPNYVLINHQDIVDRNGLGKIENYLGLKHKLKYPVLKNEIGINNKETSEYYEKILYKLNQF